MATKILKDVIEHAETWPEEDQAELIEFAHEIETRRSGVYILSADENVAIAKARSSEVVPDSEMEVFWRRFGVR